MAVSSQSDLVRSAAQLVARIERLPFTRFHLKARVFVGTATFFDAFDALSIAYVLPVLIPVWKLAPASISGLISAGYVGQLGGALLLSWLAEKRGRKVSLLISVGVLSCFSLLSAFSWNYASLAIFRFLQGLGLGGEVPVAAAYINEISRAKGRGRFVLLYELLFPVGLTSAAMAGWWMVPHWGWRPMLLMGALPGVLVLPLRWMLPESPRWLVNQGRLAEADAIVAALETEAIAAGRSLAPPLVKPLITHRKTQARELFQGIYLRRTLVSWVLWFAAYFATYGIATWLPSIYSSVFKLPISEALRYSLITSCFSLAGTVACALLIDRTGRKPWFSGAALVGGILLLVLWRLGARSAVEVLVLATAAITVFNTISLGLYLYTPELYPTRLRALGSGIGSAWLRVASAIGPLATGAVVARAQLSAAFLLFGLVLLVASGVNAMFGIETKGQVLEEISP